MIENIFFSISAICMLIGVAALYRSRFVVRCRQGDRAHSLSVGALAVGVVFALSARLVSTLLTWLLAFRFSLF